jgi:hypothetical protein
MRDINNNLELVKLQKAELKSSKIEDKQETQKVNTEEATLKDFSNPTEVLGRSQVTKSDNLKEDVAFGKKQAKVIFSSDKLFDIAFKQLQAKGDLNAYEKACAIATSSEARELLSK